MGSRMKQVALNGMKENKSKKSTENKGRNGDARATVCTQVSKAPLVSYLQSSEKPLIDSMPLFPHLLNKGHHASSNLEGIL